ncbi:GNAT family N-acetyltransferase [Demequina mangrovi]|uniref:Acetyltransferase (GNAT) family protein n=1 Tax=Demequina mangrovi TaxID=1043493 RepID=A0A1H6X9C0_9MICO|nr:GNAT family N-acetyltransferase [Demequina mangrovi]SEJ24696.1 Acetyltransferase (GNAT) family protein [Demequina mangrovi]
MRSAVRVISPDDKSRLQEIGELTALAYLADGLVDHAHPYLPQLRDAKARAEGADLLAMMDGEKGEGAIVGTITLVPPGSPFIELASDDEYELRMLAVSPIERGRGIGRDLTRAAMERAVAAGASRIVLSTMDTMHVAHRLYERMGFSRRAELDWVVVDNADGSITRVPLEGGEPPEGAVRLLGYSWEPPAAP